MPSERRKYLPSASRTPDPEAAISTHTNNEGGPRYIHEEERKPHVYLTHSEVSDRAWAAGQHRILVLVPSYCGLRWGEAIGLRVRHLDLLRKRLNVYENAVQVDIKIHVGSPRSGKKAGPYLFPRSYSPNSPVVAKGKTAMISCSSGATATTSAVP